MPNAAEPQTKGLICALGEPFPGLEELATELIFHVLPFLLVSLFIFSILFKKEKRAYIKKVLSHPVVILLIVLFFLFYPREYIKYGVGHEIVRRCECFGFPLNNTYQYCMHKQTCIGVPYSCIVVEQRCRTINEDLVMIREIKVPRSTPFTNEDALEIVKSTGIDVAVHSIEEKFIDPEYPNDKWETVTYRVEPNYKEAFFNKIIKIPIDRGQISDLEDSICEKTNL